VDCADGKFLHHRAVIHDSLDRSILREAASRALGEDVGPIDLTGQALIPRDAMASARIVAKAPGILSGLTLAMAVIQECGPSIEVEATRQDGDPLRANDPVLTAVGPASPLLTAERSALNFLQHLSGIASLTRQFVDAVSGTSARILDTRKTTPGLRILEKFAVRCGGGENHRMGLFDAFMIKDNHISLMAGGHTFQEAVRRARSLEPDAPIVGEADTLDQVREWLDAGVDRILLDNMTCAQMAEAVALSAGKCPLEASGNITLERVREVALTGVDFISVGAVTHSAVSLDFSMEIEPRS